jgi:hypothetical protein
MTTKSRGDIGVHGVIETIVLRWWQRPRRIGTTCGSPTNLSCGGFMHANAGYIPMAQWSKDHWATLAYIETVMVDNAGFQVGIDARMKTNRRNFRVMHEQCPNPKRAMKPRTGPAGAIPMRPEHATRLADGTVVEQHDDWCCIQDMADAGLFTVQASQINPGAVLHLSERGQQIAEALRAHKARGGAFANFTPTPATKPSSRKCA